MGKSSENPAGEGLLPAKDDSPSLRLSMEDSVMVEWTPEGQAGFAKGRNYPSLAKSKRPDHGRGEGRFSEEYVFSIMDSLVTGGLYWSWNVWSSPLSGAALNLSPLARLPLWIWHSHGFLLRTKKKRLILPQFRLNCLFISLRVRRKKTGRPCGQVVEGLKG